MAGKPFRPHHGPRRDSAVLARLAQLWEEAEQAGASLSQARLSKAARVPRATLNDWATGKAQPRDPVLVDAVARVLAEHARQAPLALQVWEQLVTADTTNRPVRAVLGQPIAGLDPFELEVHRLIKADSGARVLPALPPYIRRAHDEALAAAAAASGTACGRRAPPGRSLRWPRGPPRALPSMTRTAWPACWPACGQQARARRLLSCWPAIRPPLSPLRACLESPECWTACGRQASPGKSPI